MKCLNRILAAGLCLFWLGCNPPSETITLICPWASGGGTDRVSRFFADQLQKRLGQPVVVQNKTGGFGAVGHSAGALAQPDGNTLTMATFELSTMHWMGITDLTYEDFEPVLQMNGDAAAILVRKDASWKSINEFMDHIRENAGNVTMSGTATGGAWDLARAGFMMKAGLPVDSVRWIPTKGSAPSLVELMGGHIDAVCCSLPEAASQLEAGEIKALAVMGEERHPDYPDVPTCKELGIDWTAVGWRGIALPKGTPPEIVSKLEEHCVAIVQSEAFKEFMEKAGFAIEFRRSEEFGAFLKEQDAQWKVVIEEAGFAE